MLHRQRHAVLVAVLVLAAVGASSVQGRAAYAAGESTYHDAVFSFSYPTGWHSLSAAVIQQEKALFSSLRKELRLTDIGGVSNGKATRFSAGIIVTRSRLTPAAHRIVVKQTNQFLQGFIRGVSLASRQILSQGPASIGANHGLQITFLQGAGSVRLHQQIYCVLSPDMTRLYLVVFVARQRAWAQVRPAFSAAIASMRITG